MNTQYLNDSKKTIERRLFNAILRYNNSDYAELFETYEKENPEKLKTPVYSTYYKWFDFGLKLRRVMTMLALLKHTVVIVPSGSSVTVKLSGRSLEVEEVGSDDITLFVSKNFGDGLEAIEIDGGPTYKKTLKPNNDSVYKTED